LPPAATSYLCPSSGPRALWGFQVPFLAVQVLPDCPIRCAQQAYPLRNCKPKITRNLLQLGLRTACPYIWINSTQYAHRLYPLLLIRCESPKMQEVDLA
jgi:hypothetical protein